MRSISYLRECFSNIKQRTTNPKNPDYKFYGQKGIRLCPQWRSKRYGCWRFMLYILGTIGHRPEGYVLDRINNSRGYEPGNLRWASVGESEQNKGPGNRWTKKKATSTSNVSAGMLMMSNAASSLSTDI